MDQSLLAIGFKMVVALGAVLMVFGVTMMALKKFQGGKLVGRKGSSTKPLEVIAFHSLGPGRGLYLVECLGKKILVGATNANISAISEINDDFSDEDQAFASSLSEKMPDAASRNLKRTLTESLNGVSRV